jgi:hypothetical protein
METFPPNNKEDKDEPPKMTLDADLVHQTGPTETITGWKLRKANRLLKEGRCSKAIDTLKAAPLAPLTDENKRRLQELHPSDPDPHTPITAEEIAQEREEHTTELTIHTEDFKKYFATRDMTSAGGPSEWNFKRLQQVLMLPEPDPIALEGFCMMLTDIVRGLPYGTVKDFLNTSRLIALTKPDDGLRPIAMGEVFMRTAVGTLMNKHRTRLMALLHDTQVGKYLGGSEAAIHAVRARLQEEPDNIFIKVDISNAFNTISRQAIFNAVRLYEPFLLPLVAFMYNEAATLTMADGSTISSSSGVRQGDPAATLLFQLALRPVIESLLSKCSDDDETAQVLQLSLYDDFAIVGKPETALKVLGMLQEELKEINLRVNIAKTHVLGLNLNRRGRAELRNLCFDHDIPDDNIHHDYLVFLGSPIGDSESEKQYCMQKVDEIFDDLLGPLAQAFKAYDDARAPKLQSLFQILRLCGYSRINHLYRTVNPENSGESTVHFAARMWELISMLLDIPGSTNPHLINRARGIVVLPASDGGLGLPSAAIRHLAAYAGSWFLTGKVVETLVPEAFTTYEDGAVSNSLGHLKRCFDLMVQQTLMEPYTTWTSLLGEEATAVKTRHIQKKITEKGDKIAIKRFNDAMLTEPTCRNMWLSSSSAKAGAWVTRIPCYKTYEMDDKSFKHAVLARLLLPLEELHPGAFPDRTCPLCGKHNIGNFTDHSFRCTKFKTYIHGRHNAVRDELRDICVHARLSTRKEWPLTDLRRLDNEDSHAAADEDSDEEAFPKKTKKSEHRADVTIHADGFDISKLIDVTIRLPGLNEARVGGAAARGVVSKEKHYRRVYDLTGIHLIPFAAEVWGYLGAPTCDLLDWLARTKSKNRQDPTKCPLYRKHKYQYVGRVSAAIARGTGFSLSQYVYRCRRARGLLGADAPRYDPGAAEPLAA